MLRRKWFAHMVYVILLICCLWPFSVRILYLNHIDETPRDGCDIHIYVTEPHILLDSFNNFTGGGGDGGGWLRKVCHQIAETFEFKFCTFQQTLLLNWGRYRLFTKIFLYWQWDENLVTPFTLTIASPFRLLSANNVMENGKSYTINIPIFFLRRDFVNKNSDCLRWYIRRDM